MISLLRLFAFLLVSLVLLILGNGFFTTFVSVRLDLAGFSTAMIGLITAVFYAGMLLASIPAPYWIKKVGHLRVWIWLCAANSVLILLHALWMNFFYWLCLRFLGGIFLGGFFIVIESWFLLLSPSSKRSQTLSIYVIVFYVATSLGQFF